MSAVTTAASAAAPDLFWLAPQIAALRQARAQQRFPHALLIQDAPGGGGLQLARVAAQAVLCRQPEAPCGQCRDCLQVVSQTHPDLWFVGLEDESRQIRVDQIRALNETLALTGHGGGGTVAVLSPAEALNANAANALLKTLEEPRPGALLVLVTQSAARLPATVRSRCLRLAIRLPPARETAAWLARQRGPGDWDAVLEVLGNAPLLALTQDPRELLRVRDEIRGQLEGAAAGTLDIAAAAERWQREAFELRLLCAENWVTGRIAAGVGAGGTLTELHTGAHLPARESSMNMRGLIRLADALRELRLLATTPINKALAVEQLLWQLRAARTA